jgi:hypothetical protein
MMRVCVLLSLIVGLPAHAEGHHRTHPDDIAVTTTLAQRLAARSVLASAGATNIEEAHDLTNLVDDLDFAGSASFLEHLPPAKLKTFTLDAAPKTPQTVRMSRTEAKTLVKWLAPSPKVPWDASFSRVLVALVDDVSDALAKGPAPAPVAKK